MKQLEARRLNSLFAGFVRSERDKKKSNYDASLIIEVTSPVAVGGVTRDTNGDNLTVQLLTKTYTSADLLIVASNRSDLINLFFRADAHERDDKHRGAVVVYKNRKGQRDHFKVPKSHYSDYAKREATDKVKNSFGFGWNPTADEVSLIESISSSLMSCASIGTVDREALKARGYTIETVHEYSHALMFSPTFIKETKTSVVFGWMSFGTYASHPVTLKVSKSLRGPKLVRLADLGAESRGYYSHDRKHTCKPEHASALKSFARAFKRQARGA